MHPAVISSPGKWLTRTRPSTWSKRKHDSSDQAILSLCSIVQLWQSCDTFSGGQGSSRALCLVCSYIAINATNYNALHVLTLLIREEGCRKQLKILLITTQTLCLHRRGTLWSVQVTLISTRSVSTSLGPALLATDTFLSWPALSFSAVWTTVTLLCDPDRLAFAAHVHQWDMGAYDPDAGSLVVLPCTNFGKY